MMMMKRLFVTEISTIHVDLFGIFWSSFIIFSDDMIDENYGVAVQFDEDEEEVKPQCIFSSQVGISYMHKYLSVCK